MAQIIKIKRCSSTASVSGITLQDGEFLFDKQSGALWIGNDNQKVQINPEGGIATEAAKLSVARAFSISGDGTAPSVNFDGTSPVNLVLTLAETGAPGTYYKVTTDAKGRVTSGVAELQISDVTGLSDAISENLTQAKSYTNTEIASAKTELIGTSTTGATATTILGGVDESKQYTDTQINAKLSSVYKPMGTIAFASLPTPAENLIGNVYNVSDAFTTNENFVEGAGLEYPAGTNVVVIEVTGGEPDPAYKFDVLAGFVDLSDYVTTSNLNSTLADYAKTSDVASTYLTKTDASTTYATQETVTGIQSSITQIKTASGGSIASNYVTSVTNEDSSLTVGGTDNGVILSVNIVDGGVVD